MCIICDWKKLARTVLLAEVLPLRHVTCRDRCSGLSWHENRSCNSDPRLNILLLHGCMIEQGRKAPNGRRPSASRSLPQRRIEVHRPTSRKPSLAAAASKAGDISSQSAFFDIFCFKSPPSQRLWVTDGITLLSSPPLAVIGLQGWRLPTYSVGLALSNSDHKDCSGSF